MATIQIDKKFYVEQDEQQFTLKEKITREKVKREKGKKVKTGEIFESEEIHGYFISLENAIMKVIKIKMSRKNKIISLREYLEEFRKERQSLMDFLQV